MDKTDMTEEIMERPQEIMRWYPATVQKILDVRVRFAYQEDFRNPHQAAINYSDYQEHYGYTRYGKDYEAQRALRIRTIHTFFHRHKITVAGLDHMDLEELENKYQLAKLFMYRRLVQERFMAEKREEEKPTTVIIEEITYDQNIPWYYRFIPCCASTQKPKIVKPKTKKKITGGLFGRIRKLFCQRSTEIK